MTATAPGTSPVKAARHARGWTQMYAVAQLRAAATALGERLPCDASVRHRLVRVEAGERPGPFYRDLLCTIYAATPAELGWPAPTSGEANPMRYYTGRPVRWHPVPDIDAVTALLYALPIDTERLADQTPTRLGLYLRMVTTDPHCPERHTLAAGLRRARGHQPPWLDRDRLAVCEWQAARLTGDRAVRDPAAELLPDWLTGARLAAASRAAALFTNPTRPAGQAPPRPGS